MTVNKWLVSAAIAALLGLSATVSQAQQGGPGGQDNGGRGQRGQRGNFDPAQFRERMMERTKETLEVTDDNEWKVIEPLVQKVMDARMATMGGMGRGGFGGRGGRGQGGPGGQDNAAGGAQAQPQRGPFGQTPSPEAEALQKAVDGKASNAEMKAAVAKFVAARKTKQADLEKAQEALRKVLSVRQEGIATLNGLL